ncbi:MAG: two-component system regulatory protein YycI [Paenibacillaceae bacterium]|nr:two-component system regulatory protein YycI [Paenibacillaceae bacterium]
MDWSRAKTILIVSFFFLNVLLGYQLWAVRFDQSTSAADKKSLIEETNKLLESKNIRVLTKVPEETPLMKQLTVKLDEKSRNPAVVALTTPLRVSGMPGKSGFRDLLAKAKVPHAALYSADPAISTEIVYMLHQNEQNVPLFDATLQLFVSGGEISGYKQTYVEVQSGGEQKEQKVISAYTAIRALAEKIPDGSIITDIKLGYHGQQYDSETQVLLPYWRVLLAEGNPIYIKAYNGEIEGLQSQVK